MALSKRTRFEVFKRDNFTCQYCGAKAPEATLHADHIIPQKEGGGHEIANLVTACSDCNLGKGAKLLRDRASLMDIGAQAREILDREERLREYNAAKRGEREREDDDFHAAWNHWFDVWDSETLPHFHTPWENVIKGYVKQLGVEEVKDAMDITRAKFHWVKADAVRYLGGVLKRKAADAEGRVVACTYCKKRIVLDRDQDPALEWYHPDCLDQAAATLTAGIDKEEVVRWMDEDEEEPDEIALEVAAWDRMADETGL